MGRLRVAVLGAPVVRMDETPLAFPTRKALALLIYLAVEGGRHSREKLTTLFWPESNDERGRGSLRSALALLRKALDEATPGHVARHLSIGRDGIGCAAAPENGLDLHVLQAAYALARTPGDLSPAQLVAQLRNAATLYRGDFLEGFSLGDAPAFDEWSTLQREIWHRRMDAVLDRLTRTLADGGEVQPALETTARWATFDPLNETAHRRLIRLYLAAGDRGAALRAYETCRTILATELQAEPSAETEALAARLRGSAPSRPSGRPLRASTAAPPPEPPLLGRLSEHGQLVSAFRQARRGSPQVVSIEGEPGIGKTRLAAEFLQWAAVQGAGVLRGRALETGGRLPFGPLVEALRTRLADLPDPRQLLGAIWLAELSRLLPELRDHYPDLPPPLQQGEAEARTRLFEAVARLLQALAEQAPLALFLDDVHWSDAATLDLLPYALRRWSGSRTPVLLVISLRSEELGADPLLGAWLASLGREVPLARMSLGPLAPEDTARLAQALLGGQAPGAAAGETAAQRETGSPGVPYVVEQPGFAAFTGWLVAQTAGHPYFIVETVRSLAEHGRLSLGEGGRWITGGEQSAPDPAALTGFIAPRVQEVLQRRLARLGTTARQVLTAGAVLGTEFTFAQLALVAHTGEDEALGALDDLLARHLLRESGTAYAFGHEKLREVAYTTAGEARRQVLHRRALEALAPRSAPAAELARHALAAGLDEQACQHLMAAGDEAMRLFAVRDALGHYEQARLLAQGGGRAAALGDPSAPDLQHLYVQLGRAYELTAQHQQARAVYESMLADALARRDALQECTALNALATVASHEVDLDASAAYLQRALAVAEAHGDPAAIVDTAWNLARLSFFRSDFTAVRRYGEQCLILARQHGLQELLARGLASMGLIRVVMGQWEQAIADATEARALYQALGNRVMEADALVQLATAQTRSGLPRAGVEAGRAAVAISRAIENPWGQADAARALGAALTECGEYAEALAVAEGGLDGARAANYPPLLIMHLVFLGHLYQQIGALEQAQSLYLEAQAIAGHLPNAPLQELVVAALCANVVAAEDWAAACAYAQQALSLHDPAVLYDGSSFWCQVEALLRGGDVAVARVQAEEFGAFCAGNRRYRIPYLRALAVLAQHSGEAARVIAHLREAAALASTLELPGQLWPIEAALARVYQAQGDQEAAGQAQARAAGIVQSLAKRLVDEPRRHVFLTSAERQGVPTDATY